jgi:hypothetical protein
LRQIRWGRLSETGARSRRSRRRNGSYVEDFAIESPPEMAERRVWDCETCADQNNVPKMPDKKRAFCVVAICIIMLLRILDQEPVRQRESQKGPRPDLRQIRLGRLSETGTRSRRLKAA